MIKNILFLFFCFSYSALAQQGNYDHYQTVTGDNDGNTITVNITINREACVSGGFRYEAQVTCNYSLTNYPKYTPIKKMDFNFEDESYFEDLYSAGFMVGNKYMLTLTFETGYMDINDDDETKGNYFFDEIVEHYKGKQLKFTLYAF